ncbi:MAG: hypothetical protein WC472_04600 [Candidatus Paceibacterota bacterium]
MSTKRESEKPVLACSRCGKTPAKYVEYFQEFLCRNCREELKVEDYEKAEKNNGKLF